MERQVTVIIPTYKPDERFALLLKRLEKQTVKPKRILIVNTSEEDFRSELVYNWSDTAVFHIPVNDFDHGGTRDLAARMCSTPLLLFMTMDALPADRYLIERLAEAFDNPAAAVAYARQLPEKDASPEEQYSRQFNYGPDSKVKTAADLDRMGIKTYFCSDVCAMYRRDRYLELGGFVSPTIFNEDMIFAARAIDAGYAVCYCAEAKVIHSHSYTAAQQFQRNFDLGVSHTDYPEIFEKVKPEGTGIRMVAGCAGHLLRTGKGYRIPYLMWVSACKYAGYRLGKRYHTLSDQMILKCTSNRNYWRNKKVTKG